MLNNSPYLCFTSLLKCIVENNSDVKIIIEIRNSLIFFKRKLKINRDKKIQNINIIKLVLSPVIKIVNGIRKKKNCYKIIFKIFFYKYFINK